MKIITASNGNKKIKMSKKEWEKIGRKYKWMKSAQDLSPRYKSDEDISSEFDDMKILSVEITSPWKDSFDEIESALSGYVDLNMPHAEESVAGGQEGEWEGRDYWIFYNFKEWIEGIELYNIYDIEDNLPVEAKIAFDNWYPTECSTKIKEAILKHIMWEYLQVKKNQKTAKNNKKIKISRKEWEKVGKKHKWMKSAQESEYEFLVVDNEFNQANYPELIGKTFENPPAYARVKKIRKEKIGFALEEKVKDAVFNHCKASGPVEIESLCHYVQEQVSGPWDGDEDKKSRKNKIRNAVIQAVHALQNSKAIEPYDENSWW